MIKRNEQAIGRLANLSVVEQADVELAKTCKKDVEDLEAKLLTCRREIYVCFKLMGDLVCADMVPATVALDIVR